MKQLLEHPAVAAHGKGIDPVNLSRFHAEMAELGISRFLTVGAEQYSDGMFQKFEAMSRGQLKEELIEELVDVQNYVTMLAIKVLAALKEEN